MVRTSFSQETAFAMVNEQHLSLVALRNRLQEIQSAALSATNLLMNSRCEDIQSKQALDSLFNIIELTK
jgi:hypothetical protein